MSHVKGKLVVRELKSTVKALPSLTWTDVPTSAE